MVCYGEAAVLALQPVQHADRNNYRTLHAREGYADYVAMPSVLNTTKVPHRLAASLAQALQVNDDGQDERNKNDVRGLRHKLVCRPECRAAQGDIAQHGDLAMARLWQSCTHPKTLLR